jgi:hypothetical protein
LLIIWHCHMFPHHTLNTLYLCNDIVPWRHHQMSLCVGRQTVVTACVKESVTVHWHLGLDHTKGEFYLSPQQSMRDIGFTLLIQKIIKPKLLCLVLVWFSCVLIPLMNGDSIYNVSHTSPLNLNFAGELWQNTLLMYTR